MKHNHSEYAGTVRLASTPGSDMSKLTQITLS
jgi:hypothetical protein